MSEKNAGTELASLIQSMSQSERRYFKLFVQGASGGENTVLVRLFEYIQRSGVWSEEKIRREFAGEAFLKQLNVVRTRLQQLILEALANHDHGKSLQLEFARRFNEIDLLFRRKLIDSCKRAANTTLRKAQKLDLPVYALQAVNWLLRLERQFAGPSLQMRLQPLHRLQQMLLQKITDEMALVEVHDNMLCLLPQNRITGFDSVQDAEVILQKLQANFPKPQELAFDAKILYFNLLSQHALIHQDQAGYFLACKQLIATWESIPDRIRMEEERYFRTLLSFAESATKAGKMEVVVKSIAKLKRIMEQSTSLRPVERAQISNLELRRFAESGDWKSAMEIVPSIQADLKKFKKSINPMIRLSLISNAIVALFVREHWQGVLEWAKHLENDPSQKSSPSMEGVARVVRWVAAYELHLHEILEKELRPFLKTKKAIPVDPLAQAFEALLHSETNTHEKQAFATLLSVVAAQQAIGKMPHLNLLFIWATARIHGISLADADAMYP